MTGETNPQIDLGLEILNFAIQELANETGQPPITLNNSEIAEFVRDITGTHCSRQCISHHQRMSL